MIGRLNKAFESRVRLGVMALLMVNERLDHTRLKELLEVTDGNLASHLAALERSGHVRMHKRFVGRRPNTSYQATTAGRKAFQAHLDALQQLIQTDHTKHPSTGP